LSEATHTLERSDSHAWAKRLTRWRENGRTGI